MARKSAQSSPRQLRADLGLKQMDFWRVLGVTQSGGSRYESGRSIPKSVGILLKLAYGSEREAEKTLTALRKLMRAR